MEKKKLTVMMRSEKLDLTYEREFRSEADREAAIFHLHGILTSEGYTKKRCRGVRYEQDNKRRIKVTRCKNNTMAYSHLCQQCNHDQSLD